MENRLPERKSLYKVMKNGKGKGNSVVVFGLRGA